MASSGGIRRCEIEDCTRKHYGRGMCALHYKRWLRTGSPTRGVRPDTCAVDGCDRQAKSRGWCHGHYQRWRNSGDVRADRPFRNKAAPCAVGDCDRPSYARGHCNTHYKRVLATGDARPDEPIRMVTGEGWLNHGYWYVNVPGDKRWLTDGAPSIAEHRYVMAQVLGRPLEPDEVVHHLNGDRTDNRQENLELWSTMQPKGQRVVDKVEYALAMLMRYAPTRLTDK